MTTGRTNSMTLIGGGGQSIDDSMIPVTVSTNYNFAGRYIGVFDSDKNLLFEATTSTVRNAWTFYLSIDDYDLYASAYYTKSGQNYTVETIYSEGNDPTIDNTYPSSGRIMIDTTSYKTYTNIKVGGGSELSSNGSASIIFTFSGVSFASV